MTGAAGYLGGVLVRLAIAQGWRVRALAHDPDQARDLEAVGIETVVGDVRESATFDRLLAGLPAATTTLVHLASRVSIASRVTEELSAINVGGTVQAVAATRRHGIRRLVHVSSVHALRPLPRGVTQTETDRAEEFDPERIHGGYARTKAAATRLVLEAAKGTDGEDPIDAVVVYPSGIIGPGHPARGPIQGLIDGLLGGRLKAIVRGGYDFVDVRDVAGGILRAVERGRSGRGYLLTGRYLRLTEIARIVGDVSGRRTPRRPVPLLLARLAAPATEAWAALRGRVPVFTPYSLHTLQTNGIFSSARAATELGYAARDPREGLRDEIQEELAR